MQFYITAFAGDADRSAPARWWDGARGWVTGLWSRDAEDWLERIGPALTELDYQGTLVMVSGTSMETVGVFHAFDDGRERMRLVTLTGPHREVIRSDAMVMCIGTGLDSVGYDADTAGRWNPAGQFADADKLKAYEATLAGRGRVAGRDCQVVDLKPRDRWRYGYRLWLDRDMVYSCAYFPGSDTSLEEAQVAKLDVGAVMASAADAKTLESFAKGQLGIMAMAAQA